MCVVLLAYPKADKASAEDEKPPLAQTPNKKRKADAPTPKKAPAKNKKATTAGQGTPESFRRRVRTASGLPKSGGKKG